MTWDDQETAVRFLTRG